MTIKMQRFNSEVQEDGTVFDSVLYAAIYEDWRTGKITPVQLDEVPY